MPQSSALKTASGKCVGVHAGKVAIEPRHPTWFSDVADAILMDHGVSRVAADPAVVPCAADPGGDPRAAYFRLHGSPKIYYSTYVDDSLARLVERLRARRAAGSETWCIFDNTALGAATLNALDTIQRLGGMWRL